MPLSSAAYVAAIFFPVNDQLDPIARRAFMYKNDRYTAQAKPPESSAQDKAMLSMARIKLRQLEIKPTLSIDEQLEKQGLELVIQKHTAQAAPQVQLRSDSTPVQMPQVINLQTHIIYPGTNFVALNVWNAIKAMPRQAATIQRFEQTSVLRVIQMGDRDTIRACSLDFDRVDDLRLITQNCNNEQWLERSRAQDISREQGLNIQSDIVERLEWLEQQKSKTEGARKVAIT